MSFSKHQFLIICLKNPGLKKSRLCNIMPKKKKKYHTFQDLIESCLHNKHNVYCPSTNDDLIDHDTHSWFSIRHTNNDFESSVSVLKIPKESYYARKYRFYPTDEQKDLLDIWFKTTTWIYNKTLKYIKEQHFHRTDIQPSFYTIRDAMKDIKDQIIQHINIPVHILDLSIKKCVENYKSALTNFRRNNINKFRVRYYKYKNEKHKTIYLEPVYVRKKGNITQLGNVHLRDDETHEQYVLEKENIKNHFEIKYTNKQYYMIFAFEKENIKDGIPKESFISMDPGIGPFLTGVSPNNSIFIAEDGYKEINEYIKKINRCWKMDMKEHKIRKRQAKLERKMKNKVNDMHWKTIKYITSNYNSVLIGDLSAKDAMEGDGITKRSKNILSRLRLYVFKQRLSNKCKEKGVVYKEVNEYLTSKTCSKSAIHSLRF